MSENMKDEIATILMDYDDFALVPRITYVDRILSVILKHTEELQKENDRLRGLVDCVEKELWEFINDNDRILSVAIKTMKNCTAKIAEFKESGNRRAA